jgi:hypothetical protein
MSDHKRRVRALERDNPQESKVLFAYKRADGTLVSISDCTPIDEIPHGPHSVIFIFSDELIEV